MPYPSDVLRHLKILNWKNTDYVTFNDTGQCEKTCQFPDRCVHSKCFETPVPSNSPILRGQPLCTASVYPQTAAHRAIFRKVDVLLVFFLPRNSPYKPIGSRPIASDQGFLLAYLEMGRWK